MNYFDIVSSEKLSFEENASCADHHARYFWDGKLYDVYLMDTFSDGKAAEASLNSVIGMVKIMGASSGYF